MERKKDKGRAVAAADAEIHLLLFHPKAPNMRIAAGLLTCSGLHAFPSRATVAKSVRLVGNLQLRG